MKIEVLFIPGCANYEPAVARMKKVLAAEALSVEVQGIAVGTDEEARALMFPGSPTIRVDGHDVEPNTMGAAGLNCRLYANHTGVPSEEVLRLAVARAKHGEQTSMKVVERATPVAAVIAVLSTLACCLPFGFLGAVGLAGLSVRLQAARPWLLGSALILLVLGFVQLYRRNHCVKRSAVSVAFFWVAVAVVLLIILFPQLIASLVAG